MNILNMFVDFGDFSLACLLINVIFAFKISRKRPDLKWFEISLVWAFFIQISAIVLAHTIGNNLPLLHLYTLFEFIFISLFYKEIIFNNLKIKNYFTPFLGLMIIVIIGNSLFLESIMGYNSNAKGLTQFFIISYSIVYFFNKISVEVQRENLYLNRINAAILLYYAGSLFVFIFAKFLSNHSGDISGYFWEFNAILYSAFQILILITTWRLVFPSSVVSKDEE
ncbi:MAG: hypothetical protein ACI85O_001064 [Saprospiraceae bacterium]|jgi:hypothetical protein